MKIYAAFMIAAFMAVAGIVEVRSATGALPPNVAAAAVLIVLFGATTTATMLLPVRRRTR